MESHSGMVNGINKGKPKNSEKSLSQCHLSTTNLTWTNMGLCGERLVTNCLSHGMEDQMGE
jgi:hypothetical protein